MAFKALSSAPSSLLSKPRSIVTISNLRATQTPKLAAIPPFQCRFNSTDAVPATEAKTTDETIPEAPSSAEVADVKEAESAQEAQAEAVGAVTDGAFTSAGAAQAATGASTGRKPTRGHVTPGDPEATIYVGNLFFEVSEDALRDLFGAFGPVKGVKIVYDPSGTSRGFGYVDFENAESAQRAIEEMNQQVFQGRRLAVQVHRPRTQAPRRNPNVPSKTLFVGNMSYDMSDKDLNELFRDVRNVVDVRVAIDRRTGQPRGFAHADFTDVESATAARELLEGREVYGRQLRIDYSFSSARTKPE
ncbi:hypothetical protein EJ06DRAFT_530434 [Trichodelitschia bisporula]|uniref:RRM domain-containing protein n=1 Tax=Trichodelitschia bisporula TaxID=703511 RepID=A0A6G1HX91_9PEZI|nr:hypothetical protein EJ06DRAFT_530434 [Trichodelitschia bisporula]